MLKLLVSESYYLENKNTISQNNIFTNYLSDTFQYHIFLLFHTVHGVLKARILEWFAIPFSSGPHSVRSLHHDPPVLGCPTGMA